MPYDQTVYARTLEAFCIQVDVILWRNPWGRLRIAYRPASHPEGPAVAAVDDGAALPPGYTFATVQTIPIGEKFQRNRWIDSVLCLVPIVPASAWT